MPHRFELYVSYSQLAVFRSGLAAPFNTWTHDQVKNGYSWAPGSVSFKTPMETGTYSVDVLETREQDPPALGSIEVPFSVPSDGRVEVASISDRCLVEVPAGEAMLRYEVVKEGQLRLTFIYQLGAQYRGN